MTILEALLRLWHHFWAQFRHLGVTLGSFWMHFSHQKTDWGAKGAQRGATPEINSPIWGLFWDNFFDFSCIFRKDRDFSMIFLVALSALWDRLICNPSTYMQSKHTFQFCILSLKRYLQNLTRVIC